MLLGNFISIYVLSISCLFLSDLLVDSEVFGFTFTIKRYVCSSVVGETIKRTRDVELLIDDLGNTNVKLIWQTGEDKSQKWDKEKERQKYWRVLKRSSKVLSNLLIFHKKAHTGHSIKWTYWDQEENHTCQREATGVTQVPCNKKQADNIPQNAHIILYHHPVRTVRHGDPLRYCKHVYSAVTHQIYLTWFCHQFTVVISLCLQNCFPIIPKPATKCSLEHQ